MPTEAALSSGPGEIVDKYPSFLVLQLENSECYHFSPSPPKRLCSSHPHLNKTLYVSFLPSVSCLPIRCPIFPGVPSHLSQVPFRICFWENLNQGIYFSRCPLATSFIPTFCCFFRTEEKLHCHLVPSITYDSIFIFWLCKDKHSIIFAILTTLKYAVKWH